MQKTSIIDISAEDWAKTILLFLAVLALTSGLVNYFLVEVHSRHRYFITLFMWCPAFAAFAVAAQQKMSIATFGLRVPSLNESLKAYSLAVFIGLLTYSVVWTFFSKGFGNPDSVKDIARWVGVYKWDTPFVYTLFLLMMGTAGFLIQSLPVFGLELGLRGFLGPHLMRRMSLLWAGIITGLIYAAIHLPIIFFADYNAGPYDKELQVLWFTVSATAMGVILMILRVRTNSIIPGVILHGCMNSLVMFGFGEVTHKTEETWRYAGEFGMITPIVAVIMAFFMLRRARADRLSGKLAA